MGSYYGQDQGLVLPSIAFRKTLNAAEQQLFPVTESRRAKETVSGVLSLLKKKYTYIYTMKPFCGGPVLKISQSDSTIENGE